MLAFDTAATTSGVNRRCGKPIVGCDDLRTRLAGLREPALLYRPDKLQDVWWPRGRRARRPDATPLRQPVDPRHRGIVKPSLDVVLISDVWSGGPDAVVTASSTTSTR